MCGLILAPSGYSEQSLRIAMDRMGYRGADGLEGVVEGFGWKLGHVRLAIQDRTAAGSQPFISRRGMTAFVGELFNHDGMGERQYLERLLATQDFHDVDGFWAVAQVTAAGASIWTDYLSVKPMYWWIDKNIVCSEIFPMFALEDPPELDEIYLGNCIKFGYDQTGRTPWQGIRQLQAGTRLFLDQDHISVTTYWDWAKVKGDPANLRATVDRAIENRLIGDRPVAVLLSGGLDSSIVYYSLRERGYEVEAFSVENGETEFLPDGVSTLETEDIGTLAAVAVMQAPLDLGSLIPQIQLSSAVKKRGFNVVMTGDGADELFGGYRRAAEYDSQASDIFCELPYYHLPRLDRVMMRGTIELRSPFMCPQVVATALRTPRPDRTAKQALKRAYRGTVPDRIINRTKHPLKTAAVKEGGEAYRQQLVEEFRNVQAYLRLQSEYSGH